MTTICETCGIDPCFPWSDKHDDDFQKEIDREGPGLRIVKLPKRFSIPIIGRYYYWKLKRILNKELSNIDTS